MNYKALLRTAQKNYASASFYCLRYIGNRELFNYWFQVRRHWLGVISDACKGISEDSKRRPSLYNDITRPLLQPLINGAAINETQNFSGNRYYDLPRSSYSYVWEEIGLRIERDQHERFFYFY